MNPALTLTELAYPRKEHMINTFNKFEYKSLIAHSIEEGGFKVH